MCYHFMGIMGRSIIIAFTLALPFQGLGCDRGIFIVGDGQTQEPAAESNPEGDAPAPDEPAPDDTLDLSGDAPGDEPAGADPLPDEADEPVIHGWARTYGGPGNDYLRGMLETADGGYVAAGGLDGFGGFWILRLDEEGNIQWQRFYSVEFESGLRSVALASNGDVIAVGNMLNLDWSSTFFLRISADGEVRWGMTYQDFPAYSRVNDIISTPDGGCVTVGQIGIEGTGWDYWIMKLDASGRKEWEMAYGGSREDIVNSIDAAEDGGYLVSGYTASFGDGVGGAFWILKLAPDGSSLWQKVHDCGYDAYESDIKSTPDEGSILMGVISHDGVLKLDGNGNIQWAKKLGVTWIRPRVLPAVSGDGYVISGTYPPRWTYILLLRIDADGDILWERHFGGEGSSAAGGLLQRADGSLIVTGFTSAFGAGGEDALAFKTDSQGRLPDGCPLILPIDSPQTFEDVDVITSDTDVAPLVTDTPLRNFEPDVSETSAGTQTICENM